MVHEFEDLIPAYALGILESGERSQLEAHLEDCIRCQSTLASYRLVSDGLLHASNLKQPPKAIRARLLRQLDRPASRRASGRVFQTIPVARLGLAIGVILLLAANLGFLFQIQRVLDQGQEAIALQQAGQTAIALASYPTSQVAVIDEDGLRGTFVYDPDLPIGVMYLWGLQPPSQDQVYQAWLVDSHGRRQSGGLLAFSKDPGFGWLMIEATEPIAGFSNLGVTLEPAGGSLVPTGPRILFTDL